MQSSEHAKTSDLASQWPNRRYAWCVTAFLMVLYIFSFIDRTIIALLVGPIKTELGVTDTEFGLLYGLAFSLFYTFLGVPIGLLADNTNRRNIIAIGVAFWGFATAMCGFATSFIQLFIARMAVGVGEATLSPAATSMISDYFSPEARTKALSVYSLGLFLGVGLAILFGGAAIQLASSIDLSEIAMLRELRPWQVVFLMVGIPGPILAIALITLVREPKRQEMGAKKTKERTTFRQFFGFLKANANPLMNHYLGYAFLVLYAYSFTAWSPAFFERSFGVDRGEVGVYYGTAVLVGAVIGILLGGSWASRMRSRNQTDANMRIGVISAIGVGLTGSIFTLMPTFESAVIMSAVVQLCIAIPFGAAPAALFDITPNPFRAQAAAVYYFFINIIGLTIGPLMVGLLTDHVFQDEMAVGYSMSIVCVVSSIIGGIILWLGLPGFRRVIAESNLAGNTTSSMKVASA